MSSLRSPKNKYYGELHLNVALKELGSVISYSSNDIEHLKGLLQPYAKKGGGHVVIRENKAVYPAFDWQIVEEYNIG